MDLTQVARRFTCTITGDAMTVIDGQGDGVPWLTVAPGDDLIDALRGVVRAGADRRLAAWLEELRETGAARTGVDVVMPGGVRGTLTLTAVETGDGVCSAVVRFGPPGGDAPAQDELPDLRSALERLDEVCYELRLTSEGRWAATYVSPGWEHLQGRPIPEDPVERSDAWLASIHPDDVRRATATALDGHSRRQPVSHEYRIIRADGEVRWIRDRITGFSGAGGEARVTGVSADITDQKHRELRLVDLLRAVAELLEDPGAAMPDGLRGRLRAMLDGGPAPEAAVSPAAPMTFVVRPGDAGTIEMVDVDPRLTALAGRPIQDPAELVHPDDRERVVAEFAEIVAGRGEGTQVMRLAGTDGDVWLRTVFTVTSRDPLEVTGSAIDITDALTRAGTPQVVYEAHLGEDGEWRNDYLSPSAQDIFGEEVPSDPRRRAAIHIERIHGDDVRHALQALTDAVTTGGPTLAEYRIVRPDGSMRRVRTTFTRTSTEPVRLAGVMTDVSGLDPGAFPDPGEPGNGAESAESLGDALVEFEVEAGDVRARYASPAAARLLGAPGLGPGDARAAALLEAVDPRDRYQLLADVRAAAGTRRTIRGARRLRTRDGGVRWVRTVMRGSGPGGSVTCVASDISDLADALSLDGTPDGERLARIAASVPDGMWEIEVHDVATRDSAFTFVSRRMWEILGIEPGAVADFGPALESLMHPEDVELSKDQYGRALRQDDAHVSEHRIIRPDGAVRWLRWTLHGRFEDGGLMHQVGTLADVTGEIARATARPAVVPALTARQREVLDHLVSGASTEEIARSMGIRPVTVSNHVAALLRRLGVRSRLEAVAMVLGQGSQGA